MTKIAKHQPHDVLIVEDNALLREALQTAIASSEDVRVRAVGDLDGFRRSLGDSIPDLIVVDFELPDGDAFDVLGAVEVVSPAPVIVAISGVAGPDVSFRLAQLGVREYVTKPLDIAALQAAMRRAYEGAPNLKTHVKAAVGRVPLVHVEELVRTTMVHEALSRSGGNRRGAARQLDISRQLLQHMLRKLT